MEAEKVAQSIEHTQLKPYATAADIEKLCQEALRWNFYGICCYNQWLKLARSILGGSAIRLVTVAGFPTGTHSTRIKCQELEEALQNGADEVDFVLNIGWLKERRLRALEEEFKQLVSLASPHLLKVILETCFLSEEEKALACSLAVATGIDFLKTSTGFGSGGATIADVQLMRQFSPFIKASGGIKDASMALSLLQAGASRLGTSSSVSIMEELKSAHFNNSLSH